MKERLGYVSNSSSSSFIVISTDPVKQEYIDSTKTLLKTISWDYKDNIIMLPNKEGEMQFGWQHEEYHGIIDKLNFCAIQICYLKRDNDDRWEQYFEMLRDVVYSNFSVNIDIKWFEEDEYCTDYYIDHQSSAEEGQNIEMFADEGKLEDFICNPKSHIFNSNDNSY